MIEDNCPHCDLPSGYDDIDIAAKVSWKLYRAYQTVGFTPEQAFELVKSVIATVEGTRG